MFDGNGCNFKFVGKNLKSKHPAMCTDGNTKAPSAPDIVRVVHRKVEVRESSLRLTNMCHQTCRCKEVSSCSASISLHILRKCLCKECGGGSICIHGRQKSSCKECGGSSISVHPRPAKVAIQGVLGQQGQQHLHPRLAELEMQGVRGQQHLHPRPA